MLFILQAMAEEDEQKLDLRLGLGGHHCSSLQSKEDKSSKKTTSFGVCLDLSLPSHSNDLSGKTSKTFEVDGMESQNCYSSKNNNINGLMRKKLRLTKEQSALLEECFKHHTTLTMVYINGFITTFLVFFLLHSLFTSS